MRAGDRAENGDGRRRQENQVRARQTPQHGAGIARRFRLDRAWAIGSTTNTSAMNTSQTKTIASSHQNVGSAN